MTGTGKRRLSEAAPPPHISAHRCPLPLPLPLLFPFPFPFLPDTRDVADPPRASRHRGLHRFTASHRASHVLRGTSWSRFRGPLRPSTRLDSTLDSTRLDLPESTPRARALRLRLRAAPAGVDVD